MPTCKQVVRILGSDEPLAWRQRMGLRFHLMMCRHCATFSKHLKIVAKGATDLLRKKADIDPSIVRNVEEVTIEELHKRGYHHNNPQE